MRSRGEESGILLDTSFLLPILGFNLGPRVEEGLRRLRRGETALYYSQFSILEALWTAVRSIRRGRFNAERFRAGLLSLTFSPRFTRITENIEVYMEALKLYEMGHEDLIDNILYQDSSVLNLKFLTLDEELREFIRGRGLRDTTITPEELPP